MAKKKKDQKKSGSSVDFPKAKKKLGKKTQQTNLTNISFKTKGLYVPTQSIMEEKSDKPTTNKKQTLESLLVQVRHYNYNIRKEALLGICELIEKHGSLLVNYLGNILHTTIELVVDEENAVRATLRKLNSLILENEYVTETSITPFLSYIMVYIGSGLTHLTQSIRLDTVLLLNEWVKQVPTLIAQFYSELFPCFLRLLTNNVVTGSRKSLVSSSTISSGKFNKKLTSFETRMVILDCLYSYLSCLFKIKSSSASLQLTQTSNQVDYNVFNSKCDFSTLTKQYYLPFSNCSLNEINKLYHKNENNNKTPTTTQQQDKESNNSKIEMEEFIQILIPILIECWLECSPSMQSISTDQSPKSLQYMKLIAQIIDILIGYALTNCTKGFQHDLLNELMSQFNKQMFVYFPFTSVTDDIKITELLISINVSISSIISYYIIAQDDISIKETYVDTLFDFIENTLKARKKHIEHLTKSLTELLYVVERLLTQSTFADSIELLQIVSSFTETLTISSTLKHISLQLQCKLFKLSHYQESKKYGIDSSFIKEWLNKTPKLLWEMNTSNIYLTELLIDNLINIGIHSNSDINLDIIQTALIPYIYTFVKKTSKHVFGPFTKLPNSLQLLFVNLIYYLPTITSNLLSSLLMSIPKLSLEIVTAIVEILSLKLNSFEMINFLVSAIVRISTMRNLTFENDIIIFDTIISVLLHTIDSADIINLLDNLFKEILIAYDNQEDKKVFIIFLGILSRKSKMFYQCSDLLRNQNSELINSLLSLLQRTPSIEAPLASLLDTPLLLHILNHIGSELDANNVQILLNIVRCPALHDILRTHNSTLMSLKLGLQSTKQYNKNNVDAVQELNLLLGNQQ